MHKVYNHKNFKMENISLYNGSDSNACYFDTPFYDYNPCWIYNYNPIEDYKVIVEDGSIIVDVLVAGVEKENIKAWIEGDLLKVSTSIFTWNGTGEIVVSLYEYDVDKNPENIKVGLRNGVLRVEFLKSSKKLLKIN